MYNVIKFQAPFERLKLYQTSPEVSLYKAIITQAIIDASNISDDKVAIKSSTEAKEWLFGDSEDFQNTCILAGFEPAFVIKLAKDIINLNYTSKVKYKA